MNSEEHYAATKQVFREIALHKQGYYDANPGRELRHTFWQLRIRKIVIALLENMLGIGSEITKVIDVGCGRGDLTIELARRFPQLKEVWGSDFCKEALAIACADARPRDKVFFKEGNLLEMPFEDKSFDGTLCINVLHHIHADDLDRALGELARITRKYLIIEIKNKWNLYYKYIHSRYVHSVGNIEVFPTSVANISDLLGRHAFQLTKEGGILLLSRLSPLLVLMYQRRY